MHRGIMCVERRSRRWRFRLFSPKFGIDGCVFATALRQNSFVDRAWRRPARSRSSPSSSSYCGPPFPSLFLLPVLLYPHMHSLLRALRICTKDVCQPFERRTMECGFGSTNSVHTYCTLCRTRHRNTILFPRISERTPVPVLRIKIENIGF